MERYLPRLAEPALVAALGSAPVVVIDGPRAAGKTTTARRHVKSSVMLPRDGAMLEADPAALLAGLEPPVLIDEWQLAGVGLLWAVKQIVDEDPTPGRFILTGSVEPATYGPTYPLTGRSVRVVLRPMTRAELAGRGTEATFLDRVTHGDEAGLAPSIGCEPAFDWGWLFESGFPGARGLSDPGLLLDAYASTVAQRAGEEGRDATRLLRTMRVLATLEGQAVPEQRVWTAADINKATWKAYDDLLQRVHLAVPLLAFDSNRLKRLTTYPKRFFADVALSLTLADVDEALLRTNPRSGGGYLESFVAQQLRPQADAVGATLSHLRTGAGEREVDMLIERQGRIVGVEVKHSVRPTASDAASLAWLRDQMPTRFAGGYVVHTGADTYPLGDRLWAVPVATVAGS